MGFSLSADHHELVVKANTVNKHLISDEETEHYISRECNESIELSYLILKATKSERMDAQEYIDLRQILMHHSLIESQ